MSSFIFSSLIPALQAEQSVALIAFKTNAGIIIGGYFMTVVGALSAFRLFSLANNDDQINLRKLGALVLSGLLLSLGSWSCQLINGRIALQPETATQPTFVQFNPRFVSLSILVPSLLICGSSVALGISRMASCCRCIICGLVIGFSVDLMQYSLLLSTPLETHFNSARLGLSFLLCVFASIFACATLVFLKQKWATCSCIRFVVPVIFGAGISGANSLALSGTVFLEQTGSQITSRAAKLYWDGITLCVPSALAAVLCLTSIYIVVKDFARNKWRCPIPPSPKLIIASVAISAEGRVLVDDRGLLPMQVVDLDGLSKNVMNELKTHRDVFHWLYTLSFDWTLLAPFMLSIRERMQWCGVEGRIRAAFDLAQPTIRPRSTSSDETLKVRLLEATVRLAEDVNVPVEDLGHLYDRTLTTGTHMGIGEFLILSEHEATQLRDLEKSLQSCTPGDHTGLMLFFVREFPSGTLSPEVDQLQRYAQKGYRLQYMRRFRDALAQSMNASQRDVDKILLGCRDYLRSGTRPILEPSATYVSLVADRIGANGTEEVLVYDVAKHQIPSARLELKVFTPEMQRWLRNISAEVRTAGAFLELCNEDVEKSDEEILMTRLSSIMCDCFGEPYLYDFKKALADALERLLLELNFIEGLPSKAYLLSPMVVDVPSSGRAPAHLIVFKLDVSSTADPDSLPDVQQADGGIHTVNIMSDTYYTSSSGSCKTTTPATFTYTPRSLFDISQCMMLGETDDLMSELAESLKRMYPEPVTRPSTRRTVLGTDRALVSTFSIDSFSEIDVGDDDLPSPTRLRYLETTKNGLRVLGLALQKAFSIFYYEERKVESPRESEGVIRSVGTSTLVSADDAHLCSATSGYPPSRNAMEVKSNGHPYLQPRMPSPVVLATFPVHHKRRSSSVISFVASDETVTNVL
ncbi:hypothetical protein SCHPADRAFT_995683 [Schizopora paradoxa]|uniref:MHYT domain-containing protein n=1 Tax=Schizopora paradoxa TaxID=27342 RepID=A0A0H2RV12_9AGAM|nr:hypothetical protein SCHPADRAFT_995683 [Schizopora paradoxa]